MDSSLINFLNSLIKTRDFLFGSILSIITFLLDSYDEEIINFLAAGESSIAAGVIGVIISKINDITYIKWRDKNKIISLYKKFIDKLEIEISTESVKKEKKKQLKGLKTDTESTLELFEDEFLKIESLEDRLKVLVERYQKI
ncbi:MAG: hypothetical protein AAF611_18985 [Bacteroidota bacterium]